MRRIAIVPALALLPVSSLFSSVSQGQQPLSDAPWWSESLTDYASWNESSQGQAAVGVSLFSDEYFDGKHNFGVQFLLQFPFDRVGRTRHHCLRQSSEAQTKKSASANSPSNASSQTQADSDTAPDASANATQQLALPAPKPRLVVTSALARACVHAAWRAQGLQPSSQLQQMKSRARLSSLLPETRLRYGRDWGQSYRITPVTDDSYRLNESNTGARTVEARLMWKLDRLVFADEELPIERFALQKQQERGRLAGQVLKALFEWERARLATLDPSLDGSELLEATVREAESMTLVDVLTAGWFSSWLARHHEL